MSAGNLPTVFVQIPSYRDAELPGTVNSLFAKAKHPERVFVGICLQRHPDDAYDLELDPRYAAQVRVDDVDSRESQGLGWARHRAQRLFAGEDYLLFIDSHMRFVPDWDERMIAELAACDSDKPVLSSHPASYVPPDHLQENPPITLQRVLGFGARGMLRPFGAHLDLRPPRPLRAAFVAGGFIFARGSMVQEVPCDPLVYFDQEEITLSARLFTNGWDVHHPAHQLLYHYYVIGAQRNERPMHWDDHETWNEFQERAIVRYRHLLGIEETDDPEALKSLDAYGLGTARSLAEFEAFCGVDFQNQTVSERAQRALFIDGIENYLTNEKRRLYVEELDAHPGGDAIEESGSRASAVFDSDAMAIQITPDPAYFQVRDDAPPGVLVIDRFLSPAACKRICDYADSVAGETPGVRMPHDERVTQHVNIDGLSSEILGLFLDACCNRLAPYYDVAFESFERPQILRDPPGGLYDRHVDAENWQPESQTWLRVQDRDYSVVLYLNDDFAGGELEFCGFDQRLRPRPGTLVAFPSDHRYEHAALPTTSGTRYAIVSWAAVGGTERVQEHPAPGSVMVYQRRGTDPS